MELQSLFNIGLGILCGLLGWLGRTLYDAVETLKQDFTEHRVEIAKTYATKSDLLRFEDKLDTILAKVDRKADK